MGKRWIYGGLARIGGGAIRVGVLNISLRGLKVCRRRSSKERLTMGFKPNRFFSLPSLRRFL
jgi:hypothetical protein